MPLLRGRAACVACRSRKQKCNENRPECSRCQELGIKCTWPTIRRRGPAKGYAEALERRLRDTELALLQLLMVSKAETITHAFEPNILEPAQCAWTNHRAKIGSGEGLREGEQAKASMMAQWENTPLKTADGVNEWAKSMVDDGIEAPAINPTALNRTPSLSIDRQGSIERPAFSNSSSSAGRSPAEVCRSQPTDLPALQNQPSLGIIRRKDPSNRILDKPPDITAGVSGVRGKINLPDDFQNQFLW